MWEVTPSSFGKTRDWQKFFSELTLEKDLGSRIEILEI
jgi:hypothetical protein